MEKKLHFEGYARSCLSRYFERRQIKEDYGTEFCEHLLTRILDISSRTLLILLHAFKKEDMLQGSTPEERYDYFDNYSTTDEFHDLLNKMYPLLRHRLDKILDNHINNYNSLKGRVESDRAKISYSLGMDLGSIEECRVTYGVSDAHRGAKTVYIVERDNKRIVYKPRSGRTDSCWGSFIEWFNSKNPSLSLKTNKILDRGDYCWQEYIDSEPCQSEEEIKHLYRRIGMLSAAAHAFKTEDLHMENIIVSRDFPYIVDLETIFQTDGFQNENAQARSATDVLNKKIRNSVLSTQLFPIPGKFYDSTADISGITGRGGQVIKSGRLETINQFTDEVYIARTDGITADKCNIGKIGDLKVDPNDYVKEITEGFKEGYTLLCDNRNELLSLINAGELFKNISPRYLFRNTNLYAIILEKSKNPEYLKDEQALNRLYGLLFNTNRTDNPENVYRSEGEDLFNDDIPYFYGDIREKYIYNSKGKACFTLDKTPLEEISRRIGDLSKGDLDFQTDLIIKSMKKHKKTWNELRDKKKQGNGSDICRNNAILTEAAKNIGDILIKNAVTHEEDSTISWLDIQNAYPAWSIGAQDSFLYSGLAGNAIFFSTLYDATGNMAYKEVLEKILNTISMDTGRTRSKNVSSFNGIISLAYLYAFLYNQTKDEDMLSKSVSIIESCRNEIVQNKAYDIIDGLSGILVVILSVYKLCGSKELEESAIEVGRDIASNIQIKCEAAYWQKNGRDELMIAGFSHGLAGVTYALGKLNQVVGYKENTDLINTLIKAENSCYSETIENWIDLRSEGTLSTNDSPIHWCHGAAGICLSRLKNRDITDTLYDIDRAADAVIKNGLYRDSDCMCHGNLGNTDVLLELYKLSGDRSLYDRAVSRAAEIAAENKQGSSYRNGVGQDFDSPGFMLGLSGMGYQLLRLAHPEKYPSVLLLEV